MENSQQTNLNLLPACAIIKLSGADCSRYLQGRLTQDVARLQVNQGAKSLLLTPQGRIQAQLLVLKTKDNFILISDPLNEAFSEANFLSALLQFKVADQVDTESLSASFSLLFLPDTEPTNLFQVTTLPQEPYAHQLIDIESLNLRIIKHPLGYFILTGAEQLTQAPFTITKDNDYFNYLRIAAGIPLYGVDITEKTLGPELDLSELVSFTKGCYTGQEVVEMATARGRANKKLRLFSLQSSSIIKPNSEIKDSSGIVCGFITSSCLTSNTNQCHCLGYLKTSTDDSTPLFVDQLTLQVIK